MKVFLLVLVVTIVVVLLAFWGIGIKMIVKKNECVKEYVVVFKEGKIVESLRI